MKEIDRSMKYFIAFALGSAVVLPLMYETYLNLSKTIAIVLVAVWAAAAGVKFSTLPTKTALLGITAYIFSSAVTSILGFVVIHPAVKNWIENHSEYFSPTLKEVAMYWGQAFGLLFFSYVIMMLIKGFRFAEDKIRSGRKEVGTAIDNAFSEDGQ
jgi:hypothetical protein